MSEQDRPRRRWLRFSLRSLLLLVVVIAIPLAWKVNRVRNQRSVVAEVKRLNGEVNYDWQWASPRQTEPRGPRWLKNILGDDYFTDVVSVDIHAPGVTDDTIASTVRLPHLKALQIVSDDVSDAGLLHLARAEDLTFLKVTSDKITDAGFAALRRLKGLNKLSLNLTGPQITDSCLSHIAKLPHSEYLIINATNVSSDGFAQIVKLPKLIILYIDSPFLTDADLECVATAHDLFHMTLINANVTDAGLMHLAHMTKLAMLDVRGTNITAQGEMKLRQALPDCFVNGTQRLPTSAPVLRPVQRTE
jgi:hypothetical protein